jgi:hypothetical protein
MRKRIILLVVAFSVVVSGIAQNQPSVEEMRLKLNESGSHFLKWTFSNQVWFRFNESNPGTMVMGAPAENTFDIGLRRTRIQFFGQLTDHVFFYTQFGQNNFNFLSQNAGSRKLQVFFHDALGEYKVWKNNERLKLGGGLTITNGLSRFSQPSVTTIMTMDVPVFAQATVDQTDEFSRKLSVYARGQLGKFDYRVVLSDPFPITTNGQAASPPGTTPTFAQVGHHKQYQGFFIWNFLDKESHLTPYMTGTYLGKKKVLNLEAGFITQKQAMWAKASADADSVFHDMNLWSAALFYDAPISTSKGSAISAYAGYFNYDFGPNYLRYNGTMNPANGVAAGAIAGSQGNAFPMFGTGKIIYAQAGYLFGKNVVPEEIGNLMPYASLMRADYEKVPGVMHVWSVGVNWFIRGHSSKVTLDYQNRPAYVIADNVMRMDGRKSQVVLQYQIYF